MPELSIPWRNDDLYLRIMTHLYFLLCLILLVQNTRISLKRYFLLRLNGFILSWHVMFGRFLGHTGPKKYNFSVWMPFIVAIISFTGLWYFGNLNLASWFIFSQWFRLSLHGKWFILNIFALIWLFNWILLQSYRSAFYLGVLLIFFGKKIVNCINYLLISMFIMLSSRILNLLALMQFKMGEYLLWVIGVDKCILFRCDEHCTTSNCLNIMLQLKLFHFKIGPLFYRWPDHHENRPD